MYFVTKNKEIHVRKWEYKELLDTQEKYFF